MENSYDISVDIANEVNSEINTVCEIRNDSERNASTSVPGALVCYIPF